MTPGVVAAAGLLGVLLGPLLRREIFRYAVPAAGPPEESPPRPDVPVGRSVRRSCPHCAATIGAPTRRNPLGVLPPTGRCPRCRGAVGPRAGLVEVVTATVYAALAARVDDVLPLLAYAWIAGFGIVLGFVDVAVRRLPDRLTLPAGAGVAGLLGAATLASGQFGRYAVAVACALALAGAYLGLLLLSPGGLGPGDVKLALGLGFATGWYGWSTALSGALAGLLLASGYAAVLLRLRRVGRRDHLPHGPAMLAGALGAVLLAA
ncbi:prepilin peptidase [Plantactinospora sp. BC1]|uniref:prepilin peptidase n=1 Tax=Plantactinospora sp. BC1 TaxID=2108470 RepID=UPI001F35DFCB|nr:prepilin peptidase [Plantactinospora sp. BC1]